MDYSNIQNSFHIVYSASPSHKQTTFLYFMQKKTFLTFLIFNSAPNISLSELFWDMAWNSGMV